MSWILKKSNSCEENYMPRSTACKKPCSFNISRSNIIADNNIAHKTQLLKQKRISPKPRRESRRTIDYAKLNDSLDLTQSPACKRKRREKPRPKPARPSTTREAAHEMAMRKKLSTIACDSSNTVMPTNINGTEKESELADLEKIMDSFESKERIIGTIVKCDTDSLHGISDSPPRITLGCINAIPMAKDNP